ncbi:MAG: lipoyl synthase [Desulfobacterales bacterium]|nr:MAG: lipoyl synthase [Desulfobacterales bacterium]
MSPREHTTPLTPKPPWLRRRLPAGATHAQIEGMINQDRLHTVCQEARCPNIWECFSKRTATFLIMGSRCTRNCRFCAVSEGPLAPPDPDEPARVAAAVAKMGLKYVVVTSVTRDDLPDGGSSHFAQTIAAIRRRIPDARIEVLIPDFQGDPQALQTVIAARPDVLNHNVETVPRLYPTVRPQAVYHRSLELIARARDYDPLLATKSGLMLGLGEAPQEVRATLQDLLEVGCHILTLGQYLQPSQDHLPVVRYIPPEEFADWRQTALAMGFTEVASGPFVRSSYHAHELYQTLKPQRDATGQAKPAHGFRV